MIAKCVHNCKNEYQDKRYGKGMRVLNPISDKKKPLTHRCTACGREQ